jgi:hypothetical protein
MSQTLPSWYRHRALVCHLPERAAQFERVPIVSDTDGKACSKITPDAIAGTGRSSRTHESSHAEKQLLVPALWYIGSGFCCIHLSCPGLPNIGLPDLQRGARRSGGLCKLDTAWSCTGDHRHLGPDVALILKCSCFTTIWLAARLER